jgi:hypothetical protein
MLRTWTPGTWTVKAIWRHDTDMYAVQQDRPERGSCIIAETTIKEKADLIAAAPEMYEALKALLNYLDQVVLVRNIELDSEPDWALRMLQLTKDLKLVHDALAKARGNALPKNKR